MSAGMTYSFENPGTYLFTAASCTVSTISNPSVKFCKYLANNAGWASSRYAVIAVIAANNGDTLSMYFTGTSYNPSATLFYICSEQISDANLITKTQAQDSTCSLSLADNSTDHIFVCQITGSNRQLSITCSNNEYVTDSTGNRTYACISTVNSPGSGSITATGTDGGFPFIADIQLVF